jgi:hypothetical protein
MNNKQTTNNKTFDKRNPPPLTVSCAPSGDEGPTVYIQTKERNSKSKIKNNLFCRNTLAFPNMAPPGMSDLVWRSNI